MNIFYFNEDPFLAAEDHCKEHVNKIRLEVCQVMSTAFYYLCPDKVEERKETIEEKVVTTYYVNNLKIYKKAHYNHPTCRWVRESLDNYWWAFHYLQGLQNKQIADGFNGDKCREMIETFRIISHNLPFSSTALTPIRLAMTQELKEKYGTLNKSQGFEDYIAPLPMAVQAYREYMNSKSFKNSKTGLYDKQPTYFREPDWYTYSPTLSTER